MSIWYLNGSFDGNSSWWFLSNISEYYDCTVIIGYTPNKEYRICYNRSLFRVWHFTDMQLEWHYGVLLTMCIMCIISFILLLETKANFSINICQPISLRGCFSYLHIGCDFHVPTLCWKIPRWISISIPQFGVTVYILLCINYSITFQRALCCIFTCVYTCWK